MASEIKEKILTFLRNDPNGVYSIKDISDAIGHSQPTTSKWIEVLASEGKISVEDKGPIKLVRVKEND